MKLIAVVALLAACYEHPKHPTGVQPWSGPPGANTGNPPSGPRTAGGESPSPPPPTPRTDWPVTAERPETVPVYTPPDPKPPVDPADHERWWCYDTPNVDACYVTRARCDENRARTGRFDEACASYKGNPVGWEMCTGVEARVQQLSVCRRQDKVACFDAKRILTGNVELFCSKTIAKCKQERTLVGKHMRDDLKVQSDCRAE